MTRKLAERLVMLADRRGIKASAFERPDYGWLVWVYFNGRGAAPTEVNDHTLIGDPELDWLELEELSP